MLGRRNFFERMRLIHFYLPSIITVSQRAIEVSDHTLRVYWELIKLTHG